MATDLCVPTLQMSSFKSMAAQRPTLADTSFREMRDRISQSGTTTSLAANSDSCLYPLPLRLPWSAETHARECAISTSSTIPGSRRPTLGFPMGAMSIRSRPCRYLAHFMVHRFLLEMGPSAGPARTSPRAGILIFLKWKASAHRPVRPQLLFAFPAGRTKWIDSPLVFAPQEHYPHSNGTLRTQLSPTLLWP